MAEIHFSDEDAKALRDRVVVLTGGAQGIGAAAVSLYHSHGAHVYFGDWDEAKGKAVVQELYSKNTGGSVHFQKLDVRNYDSQLALFDTPFKDHGRVDVAVSCAAVKEQGGWFEPEDLDLASVRLVTGITEAPGLFAYSTAKHGVIGLMRALRPWAPLRYGVRVNALCPWATDTQLLGVKEKWVKEKMPLNTPTDVGKIILQCSADRGLNGKAVFITGGRFFDTEEGVDRTLPQWMGEQNAKDFLKGQELLGLVSSVQSFQD
ncbi:hypothetical protein SLS63_010064 [Diaporthe eres]|uniref:Uncharacterized protein n=1 Tax=Diaporthe eres TaxID=83184 RepID=A0ABR1NY64_DIAER